MADILGAFPGHSLSSVKSKLYLWRQFYPLDVKTIPPGLKRKRNTAP